MSATFAHSQTTTITIGLGAPTLLSGGLTACIPNAAVSTCVGGLATFVAYGRNLTNSNATDFLTIIPELDVSSPFVQMHPHGLSVNIDVHQRVGITNFFAYPSFFTQTINFDRFFNYSATPIAANLNVPTSNEWRHYLKDYETFVIPTGVRVAITRSVQMGQTWVDSAGPALIATIRAMRRSADVVIVTAGDINYPYNLLLPLLGDDLPDVFIDMSASATATAFTPYRPSTYNGTKYTLVGTILPSATNGVFVNFVINATKQITRAFYTPVDLTALPSALKDAEYYELQDYLREQALLASTNDPILSYTSVAVSKSRLDGYYPCLAGECAQGTLYTAAYRWRYSTDIGLTNSGGPRGPGWAAGPLRTSDIWALIPFNNYPCTGTILGLKVWELVNTSMAYLTFQSGYNSVGDRFLQTFGLQIDYDNSSLSVAAGTRVRAIRVRDQTTGLYKPLERLKYYTFATDSYQCTGMPVISTIVSRLYDGESIDTSASDELVQTSMQDYLRENDPYGPPLLGYLTSAPATSVSDFMMWSQSLKTCDSLSRWNAGLASCISCPSGEQRDSNDATSCAPIPAQPEQSKTVVNVVVPIIVVLAVGLIGAVVFVWWHSGKNVRNTKCAPKGDTATIIFTDIQMSTKLWGTVPASMGLALDQHHAMIREAIRAHDAYEVKTVGDSFMIAVDSPQRAVDLSLQIQTDFMAAKWPRCIDQAYAAESMPELLDTIDDNPADVTHEGICSPGIKTPLFGGSIVDDKKPAPHISKDFHGIRVRIGMHCGPVDAVFDEIAKGYDYYGSTVNLASRIESAADGGQVVMSRAVANSIQNNDSVFQVELLGEAELKGVIGATELLQILPVSLTQRIFTAKAIDKIQEPEVLDKSSNSSKLSNNGLPVLTERDIAIKDYISRALKPLKDKVRQQQLDILAKAWHVRYPQKQTDADKQEMTLSVIAQRIGATSTQPTNRRPSRKEGDTNSRLAADNSVRFRQSQYATSVKVFEDGM